MDKQQKKPDNENKANTRKAPPVMSPEAAQQMREADEEARWLLERNLKGTMEAPIMDECAGDE